MDKILETENNLTFSEEKCQLFKSDCKLILAMH